MDIGSKVKVNITEKTSHTYARDVLKSLQGKEGKVEEIKRDGNFILVRFSEPAKRWCNGQSEVVGFHFYPSELIEV